MAAAAGLAVVTSGCPHVSMRSEPGVVNPPVFTIAFGADGCPISATPAEPNCGTGCARANRGQTVTFQADPKSPSFFVTFDPFSDPMPSAAGRVERPIHELAPYTTYKFSVLGDPKTCENAKVVDPYIIVNR